MVVGLALEKSLTRLNLLPGAWYFGGTAINKVDLVGDVEYFGYSCIVCRYCKY